MSSKNKTFALFILDAVRMLLWPTTCATAKLQSSTEQRSAGTTLMPCVIIPKENRICNECRSGSVEMEEHFLLHCDKYTSLRDALYSQIQQIIPEFLSHHENDKLKILLGEGPTSSLVAHHIYECQKLRSKE